MTQAITERQASLLAFLKDHKEPIGMHAIVKAMHVAKNSNNGQAVIYATKCLVSLGLLEKCGRGCHMHVITQDGLESLKAYQDGFTDVNPMRAWETKEHYKPMQAFYRNNGNTHIPSRGVRC